MPYLNTKLVRKSRDEFLNKDIKNNYAWVWNLIMLEMWREKWG
jgi:hypothetical protein